jgi:hypothetical protein
VESVRNVLAVFAALGLVASTLAEPLDDVRAAVAALRNASGYSWETMARQTWREYPDYARPKELAPGDPAVEVKGRSGGGYVEILLQPSKSALDVPVRAIVRSSVEALAETPIGWMTRQEMRDSPRRGESAAVDGKSIRLFRFFSVATRATNIESPVEELTGLLSDLKSAEATSEGIVGQMKSVSAGMLQERGPGAVNSADDIRGSIVFKIRDGVLASYEVRLVSEIPRAGREPIKSTTRWTTTISSVGVAYVSVPYEAGRKFQELRAELEK